MQEGRGDYYHLFRRGVEALEREASANEAIVKLASEEVPNVEIELAPPHCPHCGKINPDITVIKEMVGMSGSLADFVMPVQCASCNNSFYATAMGWMSFKDSVEAGAHFAEKGGSNAN